MSLEILEAYIELSGLELRFGLNQGLVGGWTLVGMYVDVWFFFSFFSPLPNPHSLSILFPPIPPISGSITGIISYFKKNYH